MRENGSLCDLSTGFSAFFFYNFNVRRKADELEFVSRVAGAAAVGGAQTVFDAHTGRLAVWSIQ